MNKTGEAPTVQHDAAYHAAVVAHLERVAPLLVANFGAIPLIYVTYPQGPSGIAVFHNGSTHLPVTIASVSVRTATHVAPYVALSAHNVTWLARGRFAVELQSWSPTASDPQRAAFARITLTPSGTAMPASIKRAIRILREKLLASGLDGIPLLDGHQGMALWIPFADAPDYAHVVAWAHAFITQAEAASPDLLTTAFLRADRGNRVYLGIHSNHPGMSTVLPYIARGNAALTVALPLRWSEIDTIAYGEVNAATFERWFATNGDLFASSYAELRTQRFPAAVPPDAAITQHFTAAAALAASLQLTGETSPSAVDGVVAGAISVLADGKARTPDAILSDGVTLGVFDATLTRKHLYTDLYEYVMRTLGAGKEPEILHDDATKTFRINRPVDTWPDIALPPLPRWLDPAHVEQLVQNLTATATGDDPTAFEISVCTAFAALGFTATHIGGNGAPDGTLDAQLGIAGYRVILECKTAKPGGIVNNPRPEEPASFCAAYHGQESLLIGPAFSDEATLKSELLAHGTALWTTDDLARILGAQVGPLELLPALEPGVAAHACDALLWERDHGARKRRAVIADRILRAGWQTQVELAKNIPPAESPALTRDALFLLVDQQLLREGVTTGATCIEYTAAFAELVATDRLRPTDTNPDAYIIISPPEQARII